MGKDRLADAAAGFASTTDILIKLLDAIAPLLWPLIAAVALWKLFPVVRDVAKNRGFSVKVAGMEVSVQSATDQTQTQIQDLQAQVLALREAMSKALPDAKFLAPKPAVAAASAQPARRTILWVDDKPEGNAFEIAQVESLGMSVVTARSTAEGMNVMRSKAVTAIISDMGRYEEHGYRDEAGLELLRALRASGFDQPFLMYTGKRGAERANVSVKAEKGDGATASPVELLGWLQEKLGSQS
jgi:CheY-like chemotaxis protein